MSVLAQLVSRIPGLDDYNDQVKQNAALTSQNVQQGAQFMTLQQAMQDAPLKRELLQAQIEEHRGKANKMKRLDALAQQVTEGGAEKMSPDQLEKIGQFLAMGEHPGAATILGIADKRRALASEREAMGTLRSQPVPVARGVEPTEEAALAAVRAAPPGMPITMGVGDTVPDGPTTVQRGGLFAPLMASENPAIAARAKMLQDAMDKAGPGVGSKHWIDLASGLGSQEAQFAQQKAMLGQRGDQAQASQQQRQGDRIEIRNMFPTGSAQPKAPAGYRFSTDGQSLEKIPGGPADAKDKVGPSLSPEAIDVAAARYGIDGSLPPNLGRGAQGSMNTAAILDKHATDLKAKGMDGEAARVSQLASKSIGTALTSLERQRANVMAYEKTALRGADIALEMSSKVPRDTDVPLLDKWIQSGRKNILGDPDVTRLHNAVETLTNEYAKVMSGSSGGQATTVSMQQHAREMLQGAMTQEQFKGVVDLMKREMTQTREVAFDDQINEMKSRLLPPSRTEGKTSAPSTASTTVESAVKAAGYAYEPDKYDYRVGIGGQVQRKAK